MPDNVDEERRRQLETFYQSLSPEERRERILLEPVFRDLYNDLTNAHRVVQVPHYFWEKWVPLLGPLATTVYIQLRQHCFYNPRTGERRDWCWLKQTTLCHEIGIRDPKTLRKALRLLEKNGFIKRERTYYRDSATNRPHQGTDKFFVYFEIPLTAPDAAELLIRQITQESPISSEPLYDGKKSLHREPAVENSPYDGKKSRHTAREKIPRLNSTITSTINNVNVPKKTDQQTGKSINYLSEYLAEQLDNTKSLGLWRRFARLVPEQTLHRALSETKDAYHRGLIRTTRARYFTDLVKRYAQEQDVDLQLASGSTDPKPSLEG